MPPVEELPQPALSVVIPTLGRPTLVRTVASLIAARGSLDMEILIVGRLGDGAVANEIRRLDGLTPGLISLLPLHFASGDSSEKKNSVARAARAVIVAFVDADVVVVPDWPRRILEPFADPSVGLVSGPGLVPDDVPLITRLSGATLASCAAGYVAGRYTTTGDKPVSVKWSRLIGCNMAYRKQLLEEIGGFDPAFWPGEEMIAAFRATRPPRHPLVFHHGAWLYHYPRASLWRFCKQVYGYGATRIRLVRAGVECEPSTFAPAALVLGAAVLAAGAPFCRVCVWLLFAAAALYMLGVLTAAALKVRETKRAADFAIVFMIPLMHASYGIAEWVEVFFPDRDLSERPASAA